MTAQDGQSSQNPRYFVDVENVAEMARLIKQARLLSERFGLFPAQIDLSRRHKVLDIGCGPGEWVLELAQKYPLSQVTGIDHSQAMIEYARYIAREQEIYNVEFRSMDATQPLDFEDASIDMINARLISGFLTPQTWRSLLSECFRVLRPGGVLCNSETDAMGVTTSPSMMRYQALLVRIARMAGRDFLSEGDRMGILAVQTRLFQDAGFVNIQQEANVLNYSAGTPFHQVTIEDLGVFMRLIQPFALQAGLVSRDELELLYNRAMEEMQRKDFCAVNFGQTVWGEKPA